jgi:drug/metabolite transporter (DMT)-like permease
MNSRIVLSLIIIYIVWGSTFMAIKLGLHSFPPVMLAGLRFLLAGLIFALLSKGQFLRELRGKSIPTEMLIGLLMTGGNAGVCWGQQYITSGVAALVTGAVPLIFVLFNWIRFEKKKPGWETLAGIFIGIIGIGVIAQDKASVNNIYGVLLVLGANALWVIGSLKSRVLQTEMGFFSRSTVQMLFGGGFLILLSAVIGERAIEWQKLGSEGLYSLLYLSLIGTVLAYSCYIYLLKHVRTEIISTYALVNPLLAVLLGSFFLGEALSLKLALSTALIILSVFIVMYGPKLTLIKKNKLPAIAEDTAYPS